MFEIALVVKLFLLENTLICMLGSGARDLRGSIAFFSMRWDLGKWPNK